MGLNDYSEAHKRGVDEIDDLSVRLLWSDKVSRKTFMAFYVADRYLKGARIQLDRYKQADLEMKFLELHYYLICIDKVHMNLEIIINKLENDDKALKILRRSKNGPFSFFRLARNALEHIDSRIDEGASDLGNIKGDIFTFTYPGKNGHKRGQVSINQTELDKTNALFEQIFDILNSRPFGFAESKMSEDKNSYYLWNVEE